MAARDNDAPTARQMARARQRSDGDRSARLANALMKLSATALGRLALDEDLREAVDRARAVTSLSARRRAERALAGDLRRNDLDELEQRLATLDDAGKAEARPFQVAEYWRAKLIAEGAGALAGFPGGGDARFTELVDAAQREHRTGRPQGAARALFRHIAERLRG